MGSFFKKIAFLMLLMLLMAALGWAAFALSHGDPVYFLQEKMSFGAWSRYDDLIGKAAEQSGVDPLLIKAIVWQESRFGADKIGGAGERGLMQITEGAAADWAKANNAPDLSPERLFDPETNLTVGVWYLKRALDHYQKKDHPLAFALTEYNAGRARVKRWIGLPEVGATPMGAQEMKEKSFDSTRDYVESIEHRYEYYKKEADL